MILSSGAGTTLQHNTLKRKRFHVFNNTFWPKLLAIVLINFLFLWHKSFFFRQVFLLCCCVQVNFTFLNTFRMINFLHLRLDILYKNISNCLSFIIVVHWCKLCVQKITDGDAFKVIISRKDCAVARHYKIIFI